MKTIEFPIEEVRKKQVKEKFRAEFAKIPQELWQELADDIHDFHDSKLECIKQAKEAMELMFEAKRMKQKTEVGYAACKTRAWRAMEVWLEKLEGVKI